MDHVPDEEIDVGGGDIAGIEEFSELVELNRMEETLPPHKQISNRLNDFFSDSGGNSCENSRHPLILLSSFVFEHKLKSSKCLHPSLPHLRQLLLSD